MNSKQYKEIIRPFLSDKRFRHYVYVAEECIALASRYGVDEKKAETVGILHDIMKELPKEEQLKMMEDSGIILTDEERDVPKLWHAKCGYLYMKQVLHIEDEEMLNAVLYHTTARAHMTQLDKVLFVADFISMDRDYEGVEKLRDLARESLDKAVLEGLIFSIQDLTSAHKTVHPDSVAAYNWAIKQFDL